MPFSGVFTRYHVRIVWVIRQRIGSPSRHSRGNGNLCQIQIESRPKTQVTARKGEQRQTGTDDPSDDSSHKFPFLRDRLLSAPKEYSSSLEPSISKELSDSHLPSVPGIAIFTFLTGQA